MLLKQIDKAVAYIKGQIDFVPEVGIVLGSGLGDVADHIEVCGVVEYADIPDFPKSTVAGHKGRFIFGMLSGKRVVAMQGRLHYYEGWTPQQVVLPVRVMARLGITTLFVSNASGGLNPSFHTGDIMIITDHINLIPNPLIGPNEEQLGPRFPAMSEPYSRRLIALADEVAAQEGIQLQHGCYVGTTGPSFETNAECRYFATIGADVVGMSTTPEVIAARHMGVEVFGVSVVTNMIISDEVVDHGTVVSEGKKTGEKVAHLVEEIFKHF